MHFDIFNLTVGGSTCNPIINSQISLNTSWYEISSKQKEPTRKNKDKNQIGLVQTKELKKIMKE